MPSGASFSSPLWSQEHQGTNRCAKQMTDASARKLAQEASGGSSSDDIFGSHCAVARVAIEGENLHCLLLCQIPGLGAQLHVGAPV